MSTVAMQPKTGAPLGNSILAVCTGFGQRRTLLSPLIKKRQPKMIRRTVSAINTRDAGSKFSSYQFVKQMTRTIVSRWLAVNYSGVLRNLSLAKFVSQTAGIWLFLALKLFIIWHL